VHRDVKPSNILLRPDGSAVLTDFGLARRDDLPGLTRSGAFAGTPFYTSPEQAAGRRVDHRTDVFSLGASLYELLTLHLPFAGASSAEVLAAIQTREPVDPRRHHRTLPRDLVAVVQRALEKEPERRYPSAGAFAADLRAFGSMRPVAARTVSPLGRVRRWARRQPLQAALAVSLGIGVPLVGALAANVLANRGMVQAAERQQRLEAAQAAILGGYAHVGEGRLAEGEHDLRRALELEPGDVEAWSGLAYAALRRGPEAARSLLAELDAAPGLLAGSPTLQRSRALLLEATGDLEAAREELERLGPPRDPLDSFWVGMRLMNRALTNESEDDVRAAYQHLLDAALGSPVARPGFVYWLGAAAGALRDEPAARRAAATLQRLWPRSGFAWQGVGLALGRIDVEAAIAAYRRALELVPDSTSVRNNIANALRNAGRRDESIAILRQLVLDAPTYATAHYNLGRQLFYAEDLAQALVHLRRATELAPREATFHHYLIWCLSRTGRRDEALAAAKAALAALPREALLWRDVANVHADASDVPATRAAIEQAIALAPDDPTGHATLGDVLAAQGEAAAARRSYERRIELLRDPAARRRAREELARFLLGDRGAPGPDPAAALAIAEELAVETGRRDAYVLSVLADALFRADRAPEALAALDAAIAAAAADPKAGKLLATLRQNRENVAARLRERTDR
jgi:tetratricopeptide (TPR) repeat protein